MRDAIRIIHPRPMDKSESALYKYLIERDFWNLDVAEEAEEMEDLLPKTYHKKMMLKKEKFTPAAIAHMDQGHVTWEVATTHFGNKKEVWEACLPNMGYMAVLRNLRNMLQAGISETHLADLIADDPERVKKSRQLPFRFFSASKVIGNEYTEVQDALARAFDMSVENVPLKTGKTLVAIDFSASMEQPISKKSSVSIKEVGMCMGAIAVKLTHGAVCIFGNDIKWEPLRSTDSMVTNVNLLYQDRRAVGQATYAHLVLDDAIRKSLFFDRIILLSDMQCYSEGSMYGCDYRSLRESLLRYRRDINPRATFISVDLEGYGTVQMPDDDPQVMLVGGWNDAIYRLIDVWENGEDYLEEVRSL